MTIILMIVMIMIMIIMIIMVIVMMPAAQQLQAFGLRALVWFSLV